MLVTVSYYLDKRRARSNNEMPVKLRVYNNGKPQLYQTQIEMTETEFKKLGSNHIREELQKVKVQLNELKDRAEDAIKQIRPFTFEEFERKFIQFEDIFIKKYAKPIANSLPEGMGHDYIPEKVKKKLRVFDKESYEYGTLGNIVIGMVTKLLLEERIGSAESYDTSFRAFLKFKGNVHIESVTPTYLMQFEKWMLAKGRSKTTVGIYTRNLRAIFNEAIHQEIVPQKMYPFGRRKYRILSGRNVKKALTVEDINKIYKYQCDPENPSEQKAKDFWLFSYFINGINIADIVQLKYSNIHGKFIIFERAKTENSLREKPVLIHAAINEDVQGIIDRWGNKDKSPDNFIFPVLDPKANAYEQYNQKKLFLRLINDWLKHIQEKLQIDRKLTTYVARHTFSTIMKNSGASIRYIQEALGHQTMTTTENYLGGFDDEAKLKWAANLDVFKQANESPQEE